jgi:integrase
MSRMFQPSSRQDAWSRCDEYESMSARHFRASWWADFRWCGTRYRIRSPDNSKAGAQAYEAMLRSELAARGSLDHIRNTVEVQTLADFVPKWLKLYVEVNNKPSEQHTKRRVLKVDLLPVFGKKGLQNITAMDVEDFKRRQLAAGRSPKTINNSLTILRKCLVTAIEWGELNALPKIKLLKTVPPKFAYLIPEEIEQLLALEYPEPWKTVMHAAVRTGLRSSELIAIEWEDVNLTKRILCVRHATVRGITGTPKNGRVRYVPLTRDLAEALGKLPRTNKLVFHDHGKQITYSNLRFRLRTMCEQAGIRVVSCHALRHTFASQLAARKASLKAIQELLGHSTINMTLRYSHLNQDNLREAIELLEPQDQKIWATGGQREEIHGSQHFDLAKLLQLDSPL